MFSAHIGELKEGKKTVYRKQGEPLTVSELNEYARRLLAGDPLLRNLEVTGEISGYKHHFSGHRYFTLKDQGARIQCVMFRQDAMGLDFQPVDGMKVTLTGSASIFVRDGSFQLYVSAMRKSGVGDLYARFERLKAKLAAEGMFDPALKQNIPVFPKKIGIVTSETGAAIRDMIRVARRRNPNIEIIVAPCAVQGETAAKEIAGAIRMLNARTDCDVLLVGRGGGSIEDLWAFNEEIVARAISASRIPVISCVGHEIDFTIADFVADLRAPTPSAAAELAVPVLSELNDSLNSLSRRLSQALSKGQQVRRAELSRVSASMALNAPERMIVLPRRELLERMYDRVGSAVKRYLERGQNRLNFAEGMLRTLDPDGVVERGYAIVYRDKKIIENVSQISDGDALNLRMAGGEAIVVADCVVLRDENG